MPQKYHRCLVFWRRDCDGPNCEGCLNFEPLKSQIPKRKSNEKS